MSFNLRLRKQNLALTVCVVFLVSLTLSLLQRATREKTTLGQLSKCRELNRLFEVREFSQSAQFSKTASDEKRVRVVNTWKLPQKDKGILEHVLLTQECPWEPNPAAMAQYRAELGQCCNASFSIVLTKENTPLGSSITFDGMKGKAFPASAKLVDLLPERSPFPDSQYSHCAVVGNGGILRNSSCGQEIDRADLVIRFNLPPMNFSEDVGTKSDLVTLNPSILNENFQRLSDRRKPFADSLRLYGGAFFLIPAFSFVGHTDVSYRALYTMEDFGLSQRALFLNPHYLAPLGSYWKSRGLGPKRLSSGFMFTSMALELCERITLYGFWPFQHDLENQPILHHYYDNRLPKQGVHEMPSEFSRYLDMYAQGVLRLRLGKCP
ncbi:alpha-2,8-sialyltransferase 8F-like isoform X1 [Podarcis lilfordi]|uniref:Alpha-2,8-sialyltransferase 8F-like isoform X1 n=1 Tax=Podarcis lilfordi TaxID=74358 RepID=A0AA35PJG0_9SAUR|nr:alpha-2,8-sialyltransferase 8F-like isoform X1 [Podarcis lilfordi]